LLLIAAQRVLCTAAAAAEHAADQADHQCRIDFGLQFFLLDVVLPFTAEFPQSVLPASLLARTLLPPLLPARGARIRLASASLSAGQWASFLHTTFRPRLQQTNASGVVR